LKLWFGGYAMLRNRADDAFRALKVSELIAHNWLQVDVNGICSYAHGHRLLDFDTGSNVASEWDFRSHDGGALVSCAVLKGGFFELPKGKLTGALDCNSQNLTSGGNITMSAQKFLTVGVFSDATRGAAGTAGRVIFNTTDANLNIDDGTNWILPDGTAT